MYDDGDDEVDSGVTYVSGQRKDRLQAVVA